MPLVNTKDMFKKAYEGNYSVGAFNVNNMEIIQAITHACKDLRSPVILQVSSSAIKYAGIDYLVEMVKVAIDETSLPIALHLDHGSSFEICKQCIDKGFSSVMIDGSSLSYEDNIEVTRKVVSYAHERNVTVEAELGRLAGIEDKVQVNEDDACFTDPAQAEDFVSKTNIDSLAIAIGTSHGAYKFKPNQKPQLRFDILEQVAKRLPRFPIVLHGASSVVPEFISTINSYGGNIPNAIGIPESMLKKASEMAVCKINVDSDIRLAMTAAIRKHLSENPENFDPRKYLSSAKDAIYKTVSEKITNIFGSADKI